MLLCFGLIPNRVMCMWLSTVQVELFVQLMELLQSSDYFLLMFQLLRFCDVVVDVRFEEENWSYLKFCAAGWELVPLVIIMFLLRRQTQNNQENDSSYQDTKVNFFVWRLLLTRKFYIRSWKNFKEEY